MTDTFQHMIDKHRRRMAFLRETFDRQGYLLAVSSRDPSYSIFLSRNPSSEAPWRVTSFRSGVPVGHREYDRLEGGSPIQNSFAEFASADFILTPRPRRQTISPAAPSPT
jgi:hypothetical protein